MCQTKHFNQAQDYKHLQITNHYIFTIRNCNVIFENLQQIPTSLALVCSLHGHTISTDKSLAHTTSIIIHKFQSCISLRQITTNTTLMGEINYTDQSEINLSLQFLNLPPLLVIFLGGQ